jgi:trigger factor
MQQAEMPMDIKVEEISELERRVTVTIPAEEIDKMANARFGYLAQTQKIDGFREGHVPVDVIRQRFGGKVYGELKEQIIQTTAMDALNKNEIRAAGMPAIEEAGTVLAGQPMSYTMKVDLFPEIKPTGFEGLKLEKEMAEPNDDLVKGVIDRLLDMRKTFDEKKGAVEAADRITLNATGILEGEKEAFPGGEMKDQTVELGQGMLIPGFEEHIVGMKAGETKEFTHAYPKDFHNKELAGKKSTFTVEVTKVESVSRPEVDEAFAKESGADSVDALMTQIKDHLTRDLQNASEQRLKRTMFDKLDEKNAFTVPAGLVDMEFNSIWNQQLQELQQRGMSMDNMDKSEDDLRAEYRGLAERRVRLGLLLAEIGKVQDIKVSDAEIDAEVAKISLQFADRKDEVEKFYANPEKRNQIAGPLYEKKVTDWLMSKSEIKEKTVDPKELIQELG